MTDLVLLLPDDSDRHPEAREVRSIVKMQRATVASVQVPRINDDGSLDARAFVDFHHQHGVDLSTIDPIFRLRDIILVQLPFMDERPPVTFCLVYLWNWPGSTYDIDAVRIPHASWTDPRNNPRGKNPGNVWSFPTRDRGDGERSRSFGRGMPIAAVERLVRCHSLAGDTVHGWLPGDEEGLVAGVAARAGRRFKAIDHGDADPVVAMPFDVDPGGGASSDIDGRDGTVTVLQGCKEHPLARYFIQDAITGIPARVDEPIVDVVTSPPYNIGYDPFNVPKPDPRNGQLVAPRKAGYRDDLPRAVYRGMIKRVLDAIDARMNPASADAFINMKNAYSGGACDPPFWVAGLVPRGWRLSDLLVWRYDISYDPAKGKYKPYYEWILRFTRGTIHRRDGHRYLQDHYIPILKGNSKERLRLVHPAIYPKKLVKTCLAESGHEGLVVDPFLGSGTTIAAAWEANRPSIGFEIDPRYLPDIETRLLQATRAASTIDAQGSIIPKEKITMTRVE